MDAKRKAIPKSIRMTVYQKCDGHCAYCGCDLEYKDMQVDHVVLRSALNGVHDGRGVMDALDEYYMQLTALVTAFNSAETQNRVELSGLLKNLQIGAIKAYTNMLNAVADM